MYRQPFIPEPVKPETFFQRYPIWTERRIIMFWKYLLPELLLWEFLLYLYCDLDHSLPYKVLLIPVLLVVLYLFGDWKKEYDIQNKWGKNG